MFSLTGTWDLLRAAAGRAGRGLAAVEPHSLVRHAQYNAATAVMLTRARRLEEEADHRFAAPCAQKAAQR